MYKYISMSIFLLPHYHKSHLCTGATRLPLSPYSVARRPRTAARGETRRPSYINIQLNMRRNIIHNLQTINLQLSS